jgi:hypothetical protein
MAERAGDVSGAMGPSRDQQRIRKRLPLSLPVRVSCRESAGHEWVEITRLIEVTPFGAGLTIGRPTEPGRLLHLTLPMPRQLRCFDYVEDQYRVWALVRYVKRTNAAADGNRYEIGVAFVGKHPPASFEKDPTTRYQVATSPTDGGFWGMRPQLGVVGARQQTKETRHKMAFDIIAEIYDENGEVVASETTVTENISRQGASVFTTLSADRGRFVRLRSPQKGNISVIAAVRNRRVGPDGMPRLHLEFVDGQWPLDGIEHAPIWR